MEGIQRNLGMGACQDRAAAAADGEAEHALSGRDAECCFTCVDTYFQLLAIVEQSSLSTTPLEHHQGHYEVAHQRSCARVSREAYANTPHDTFHRDFESEQASGIILMVCTLAAIVIANSPLGKVLWTFGISKWVSKSVRYICNIAWNTGLTMA